MICKPYKINTDNIIIKKSILSNLFPIKLMIDKESSVTTNIILQTPIMFIPFGVSTKYNTHSNYKNIEISFKNNTNNKDITYFENMVDRINIYFKTLGRFKGMKYISCLKTDDFFPNRLKLKYMCDNNILIYNEDNILTNDSIESIKPSTYGKFILQITNIWINKNKNTYGIIWNICQIKLYKNLELQLEEFAFIDDSDEEDEEEDNRITNKEHYGKYFTMLKRGVPIFAVKQKMILDKIDPDIIDKPNGIVILDNPIKTNLNPLLDVKANIGLLIKNNDFKLKKTSGLNKKESIISKLKTNSSILVPSAKDIINAKNRLKNFKAVTEL